MKQIWKYIIRPDNLTQEIPTGGVVLFVGTQFEEICVWVEVDPEQQKGKRHFEVYGTGHPIPAAKDYSRTYLGSAMLEGGALAFHVYEKER